MKRTESKLTEEQALTAQTQGATEHQGPLEFATAEDLLRFDAKNTPLPESVEQRLRESLAREPRPPRRWWQRLFGS